VLALKEQLGPILWQFPANLAYNPQRFQQFLEMLPRDSDQAAQLAAQHSAKVAGDRVYLEAPEPAVVLRYAFEVCGWLAGWLPWLVTHIWPAQCCHWLDYLPPCSIAHDALLACS
jgi:hypothetical protein